MMNKKILLYLALMSVGLYAMPNTVSIFAEQHAFYSGIGLECKKCHSDVHPQLEMGASYEKHKAAAANINYTTYLSIGGVSYSDGVITDYKGTAWNWNPSAGAWQNSITGKLESVSLDKSNDGIKGDEICMLCHDATLTGNVTHTGVIVRACDDDRCHGNMNNSFNFQQILGSTSNITAAGYYLGRANVHQAYYLGVSDQPSSYMASQSFGQPGNAYGSFTSKGFWACEGCHTDITVNATIAPAPAFNHSVSNPDKKRYK